MLPQAQVLAIEVTNDLTVDDTVPGSIGTINSTEQPWPLFVLSKDFELLRHIPENYRYCVGLNADARAFAIACETVSTYNISSEAELIPIFDCMRLPENPLHALVLQNKELMMVSSADTMQNYLNHKAVH